MSRTLLSDDGRYVFIYEDGYDEPEMVESAEYIEEHGFEQFKETMTDAQKKMYLPELNQANIAEYYKCLLDVAYKNGRLNQLVGIRNGTIDGSESAVKATKDYFENDGSKLDAKIQAQRIIYKRALIRLNESLKALGLEPLLSEKDAAIEEGTISTERLSNLMNKMPRFRDKFRQKINHHAEEGVAVTIDQLVAEALATYRKR